MGERGDTMVGAIVRSGEVQDRGGGSRRKDELFGTARGEQGRLGQAEKMKGL